MVSLPTRWDKASKRSHTKDQRSLPELEIAQLSSAVSISFVPSLRGSKFGMTNCLNLQKKNQISFGLTLINQIQKAEAFFSQIEDQKAALILLLQKPVELAY